MSYDVPVNFRDLVPCKLIEPARMSEDERRQFHEDVKSEMDRLGITRQNEITAQSEILTEKDYTLRINARIPGIYLIGGDGRIVDVI